jgi:hypothetical protein
MGENVKLLSPDELPEALKAAFAGLYDLDCEIADLKAEHIEPVTDKRTSAWRRLKASTGINRKDLKLYFDIYKRAREADDMDDETEGEAIKGNLRRLFEALREGETLDWIGAVGETGEGPEEPDDGDEEEPLAAQADDEEDATEGEDDDAEEGDAIAAAGAPRAAAEHAEPGPDADWGKAEADASDAEFDEAGAYYNIGMSAGKEGSTPDNNPYPEGTIKASAWERGRKAGLKAARRAPTVIPMMAGFSGTSTAAVQ